MRPTNTLPNRTQRNYFAKVIASIPANGQEPITELIGEQFPIVCRFEDGGVSVNAAPFEGVIILNPGEFELV